MKRVLNPKFWQLIFGPKMHEILLDLQRKESRGQMTDLAQEMKALRELIPIDVHITPEFLERKYRWSLETFGPGYKLKSVTDHIREEVDEAENDPHDAMEWADIILLAFDGAARHGISPIEILGAIHAKQAICEARTWPDWRTVEGKIKHIDKAREESGSPHAVDDDDTSGK